MSLRYSHQAVLIAGALGLAGLAPTHDRPAAAKRDPMRDRERIEAAKGKRARKAEKRARIAARAAGRQP